MATIVALHPSLSNRNVRAHEHVEIDLDRAVEALGVLGPVERFLEIAAGIGAAGEGGGGGAR